MANLPLSKNKQSSTDTIEGYLQNIYYDVSHPAGYSNPSRLLRQVKKDGRKINLRQIKDWLSTQETYSMHKPRRKKFPRDRIVVQSLDQQWEIDLSDLSSISKENKGYRYLFCCIDVLSKYAWVLPLKNKTGAALVKAFQKLFKQTPRRCQTIRADKGGEFVNKQVKAFLKKHHVHFFTSQNEDIKCSIVERFQRSLKDYMWRYFTRYQTRIYIDKLQQFVHAYNHRWHRSIKLRPVDVTIENSYEVLQTLYPEKHTSKKKKYIFKLGDEVRISRNKGVFGKGYDANWSREIFTISHRFTRKYPVYRLFDSQLEPIVGTFYENELQKVTSPEEYKIEKILEERNKGKKTEYLVKWLGYPASANTWIKKSQLTSLL